VLQSDLRAVDLAGGVPPGADGLVVLPFLSGERAPYWRSSLRGAFDGLDLSHDRATIVRAFRWLVRKGPAFGVRVVLCPFGDDPETRGARSPVPGLVRALDEAGVIVVAAAGWDPGGDVVSPASSPHVIGVSGWDIDSDRPAHGPRVSFAQGILKPDLLAPAVPLPVPRLDGRRGRDIAGGTSFAAAIVAGVALHLVRDTPALGKSGVLKRLVEMARPVAGQPPYLDPKRLSGLRAS